MVNRNKKSILENKLGRPQFRTPKQLRLTKKIRKLLGTKINANDYGHYKKNHRFFQET